MFWDSAKMKSAVEKNAVNDADSRGGDLSNRAASFC